MEILYHGSDKIVRSPLYGVGRPDNDFGSGFYMTEDVESAKEWAAVNGQDGNCVCNQYEIDLEGLNVIRFEDYGILAWMAEVIANRGTDGAVKAEVGDILVSKYKIDTSKADVIIGYRADDSYNKIVKAFLEAKLTIDEVAEMFREWQVGTQVFIKSPETFARIRFIGYKNVKADEIYGENEIIARWKVSSSLKARRLDMILKKFNVASKGFVVGDAINEHLEYKDGCYRKIS